MGVKERYEFFIVNGRLLPLANKRPKGLGPWPKLPYPESSHVATIEGKIGEVKVVKGPKSTKQLLADSIAIFLGMPPASFDNTIWSDVPSHLRKAIRNASNDAARRVSDEYDSFSNEETETGALFSGLNKHIISGRWEAKFKFVEFSKQVKENKTGADIAIFIDLENKAGKRSVKTLWFQAKRNDGMPSDWRNLPRLDTQLTKMKKYTNESFALLYTPDGVFVCRDNLTPIPFGEFLESTMACMYGDTSVKVLAESCDRKSLFQVVLNQTS